MWMIGLALNGHFLLNHFNFSLVKELSELEISVTRCFSNEHQHECFENPGKPIRFGKFLHSWKAEIISFVKPTIHFSSIRFIFIHFVSLRFPLGWSSHAPTACTASSAKETNRWRDDRRCLETEHMVAINDVACVLWMDNAKVICSVITIGCARVCEITDRTGRSLSYSMQ